MDKNPNHFVAAVRLLFAGSVLATLQGVTFFFAKRGEITVVDMLFITVIFFLLLALIIVTAFVVSRLTRQTPLGLAVWTTLVMAIFTTLFITGGTGSLFTNNVSKLYVICMQIFTLIYAAGYAYLLYTAANHLTVLKKPNPKNQST